MEIEIVEIIPPDILLDLICLAKVFMLAQHLCNPHHIVMKDYFISWDSLITPKEYSNGDFVLVWDFVK